MDALTATEAQTPPSSSSSYIEPFAQISALQAKGDHYGLIQAAERVDLTATNDNHPARLLITIPLVLSCMIVNDLPAEFDPPSQLLSDHRTYTDPRRSLR